jgi:hypothetical protein
LPEEVTAFREFCFCVAAELVTNKEFITHFGLGRGTSLPSVRKQDRSIGICHSRLPGVRVGAGGAVLTHIDLVFLVGLSAGKMAIPWEDARMFQWTFPTLYNDAFEEACRRAPWLTELVRTMKMWKYVKDVPFKSILLEQVLMAFAVAEPAGPRSGGAAATDPDLLLPLVHSGDWRTSEYPPPPFPTFDCMTLSSISS